MQLNAHYEQPALVGGAPFEMGNLLTKHGFAGAQARKVTLLHVRLVTPVTFQECGDLIMISPLEVH